jgi:two-component system, OmpR family, phosphate regulon sensor histidine kinase PhoR
LPQAVSKKIALNLDSPSSLTIVADPVKLTRLLLNLIDNAIKYSNPGDSVKVMAALQNGHIQISVADTGPGIPREHLTRLFERFYRVDQARSRAGVGEADPSSGAGLGLSIVDSLVKAHQGGIEVTSQVGQGSTFTVCLPLKPSAGN